MQSVFNSPCRLVQPIWFVVLNDHSACSNVYFIYYVILFKGNCTRITCDEKTQTQCKEENGPIINAELSVNALQSCDSTLFYPKKNKKLNRCWDSATCEPSDAAEVQNTTFSRTPLVVLSRIRNRRILQSGRLRHACSQDTCPVTCPFPLFIALCDHIQSTSDTDGRTDRRHARSISAICHIAACHAEKNFCAGLLYTSLHHWS